MTKQINAEERSARIAVFAFPAFILAGSVLAFFVPEPFTPLTPHVSTLIAIIMLVTGDEASLDNLQNITIIAASPFVLIIIALMFAIVKALSEDPMYLDQKSQRKMALRVAREHRLRENRRKMEAAERTAGAGSAQQAANDESALEGVERHDAYDGEGIVEVARVDDVRGILNEDSETDKKN